jgi:histidinol-phosphate aminotransferase
MSISRRNLLHRFGAGVVLGTAARSLSGFALTEAVQQQGVNSAAGPILLSQNENAYGPSQKVLAAIREAASFSHRYPRTEYEDLLDKIAALHRVKPERIVLACGSTEILRAAAAVFLGPGKNLVQASPTFFVLGNFASRIGAEVFDVPLGKTYEHDLDAMLARATAATGLVYVCNPNNPTGTLTRRKDLEDFIRRLPARTLVLIDEAYHHFVGETSSYASFLDRPVDGDRVIVARTFSKIYGLAGMRVGYAVASSEVARRLSAETMPYGVSIVSAKAAAAALDDVDYLRLGVKRNTDDRQEFMNQVNARMIRALDSHANFVMVNSMRPSIGVVEHLKKNNVIVAPPVSGMDKYVRVSLGTPPEMRAFWRAWDLMPAHEMAM